MIDLSTQWVRLIGLNDTIVTSHNDREQGANYALMLQELRHDRMLHESHILGMYRAPASKDRHHDREGGLVQHLLEMWDLWQEVRPAICSRAPTHTHLNDSMIWRAILHHDLNKVWRYRLVSMDPWRVEYADDRMTALLGATNKSLWLLQKYNIKMDLPLTNALLGAEGGFAKIRTPVDTVLTKIVYLLDEMSANVVDRLKEGRFWDSKAGGMSEET